MNNDFFASLFDMSFSEFVTIRLIKILYILGIASAVFIGLSMLITGFSNGIGPGIVSLVVTPLVVGIYILMVRIWLELIVVMFKIAENTSQMAKNQQTDTVVVSAE
ncbi:MAG: hypothetical protein BA869_06260 [Desulfuromonadales bacterium C00003107]|nr:MAG: hypothetical protein BA869_06260 [Desulfuromonadales bacterium C00003107]